MIYIAITLYLSVMTLANYMVFFVGPNITPVVAFLFIGFHLAARDWLQMRLKWWGMASLVLLAAICTLLLAPGAEKIALASAVAFLFASLFDWLIFSLTKGGYVGRSIKSNVAGSAFDSIIFPTLAFGVIMPHIIIIQFAAKIIGGAMWAAIINKVTTK